MCKGLQCRSWFMRGAHKWGSRDTWGGKRSAQWCSMELSEYKELWVWIISFLVMPDERSLGNNQIPTEFLCWSSTKAPGQNQHWTVIVPVQIMRCVWSNSQGERTHAVGAGNITQTLSVCCTTSRTAFLPLLTIVHCDPQMAAPSLVTNKAPGTVVWPALVKYTKLTQTAN